MREYLVEAQSDFLEHQARAQPIAACAELIWNGLDADATTVHVDFVRDPLGGLSRNHRRRQRARHSTCRRPNTLQQSWGFLEAARRTHEASEQAASRTRGSRSLQGFRPGGSRRLDKHLRARGESLSLQDNDA